jgi:hypothetical protein
VTGTVTKSTLSQELSKRYFEERKGANVFPGLSRPPPLELDRPKRGEFSLAGIGLMKLSSDWRIRHG